MELYFEYLSLGEDIPQPDTLEFYDTLEEAAGSEFFPYFLELDKRTDKKVLEVMKKIDDTREYGMRVGSSMHGGEPAKIYIEMFNSKQPELREYFQLVEYQDGRRRYTATHESCFMQLEMGQELYEAYFGPKREPEYYIDTDKNEFTGARVRYRFIFHMMQVMLHEHVMKTGGFVEIDPGTVSEEKVEFLVEQGVIHHMEGDEQAAVPCFREAVQLLEKQGIQEKMTVYLCTCQKIAMSLERLDDPEAEAWWKKIYALREEAADETAASCVAEAVMSFYRQARQNNEDAKAKKYLREVLELMQEQQALEEDWETQFEVHLGYAYLMEEEDLEESLREYRKAIHIARDHHLEQVRYCAKAVETAYNNYAWVLWNKCGSEEAILYYGRAIELLESYLFTGIIDKEAVYHELRHVGSALNRLYLDTNHLQESERLKERLAENGVAPDERPAQN